MGQNKNSNQPCCNNINLTQLAVTAAFLTLAGDFLAFVLAVLEAQKECESNIQAQVQKDYAKEKIGELEKELYELKQEIDR